MDGLNEKFGRSLRNIRRKMGWTQEELAKRLNTSKQVISKYENSQRSPNIYVANAYAKALGVTLEEMLEIERTDEQSPAKNVRRIDDFPAHRIPLIGSAAAGEPVYNEEVDVYIDGPLKADCAIRVQGDSMEPTFLDGDILYVREQPDIDYEGQIAVIVIGDEACVKHVYRQKESLLLISDNTKYAPMVKLLGEGERVRILGRIIGYTRMFKE